MPRIVDYWSQDSTLGEYPVITNAFPRNRFWAILWNLHFNDNSLAVPRGAFTIVEQTLGHPSLSQFYLQNTAILKTMTGLLHRTASQGCKAFTFIMIARSSNSIYCQDEVTQLIPSMSDCM